MSGDMPDMLMCSFVSSVNIVGALPVFPAGSVHLMSRLFEPSCAMDVMVLLHGIGVQSLRE